MISLKAKKLVPATEQLQALTPAELTEVSGGGGDGNYNGNPCDGGDGGHGHHHHHWHHWRHGGKHKHHLIDVHM